MKKKEKIWWILIGVVLAIADLMAIHNIRATDAKLKVEFYVLAASIVVFIILAIRMKAKR